MTATTPTLGPSQAEADNQQETQHESVLDGIVDATSSDISDNVRPASVASTTGKRGGRRLKHKSVRKKHSPQLQEQQVNDDVVIDTQGGEAISEC